MNIRLGKARIQRTLLGLSALLTLGLSSAPTALAQSRDFNFSHRRGAGIRIWKVVDTDPAGLNCRIPDSYRGIDFDAVNSPDIYGGEYDGGYIRVSQEWSPLTQLKPGRIVEATVGHFEVQHFIRDRDYKPWLLVKTELGDCFVRARADLIQPMTAPRNR